MKGADIVDAAIEAANHAIVVETPNGVRMVTTDYRWDTNKRGEPVLVIKAGRKLTS